MGKFLVRGKHLWLLERSQASRLSAPYAERKSNPKCGSGDQCSEADESSTVGKRTRALLENEKEALSVIIELLSLG